MVTNISCLWLVLTAVVVIQAASIPQENPAGVEDSGDFISNGVKYMYRVYRQCESDSDLVSCLKLRALRFSDRALSQSSIPVTDGLTLVNSVNKEGRSSNTIEDVDETSLPQDLEQRNDKLDELLVDRLGRFFSSFTVQMSMPKFTGDDSDAEDNSIGTGRQKRKGMGSLLLIGAMMKGGLLAMGLKGLALLAGKALLVAKIALVLSVIVALSKLAGGGHEKTTYEIVKHPHVSHGYSHSSSVVHGGGGGGGGGDYGGGHYETSAGGWGRSYLPEEAQNLAYRGQQPVKA